ncbi:MAG: hypothetical protein MK186_08420, partial [Henriciella sp.]|nr:hypothetical protein [Henriciella sp.]
SGGSWVLAAYLGDRVVQATNDQSASSYSLSEARPRISKRLADFSKVGNRDGRYRAFAETIAQNVTFGQIGKAGLPDPFFNITLMPAQAPFVFTEAYLDHYSVESFVISERTKVPVKNVDPLSDLPIGLAAVISGYVPGWYHSYAETGLCSSTPLKNGSLCRNGASVDKLSLVDGGLYDNYGYKSAFELFASIDPDRKAKRLLIQIDVTTNLPFHTSASKKPPGAAGILRSLSFANQDASFLKGFQLFAGQMEIDTVVLDLYSTAKFDPDTQSELVADLSALRSIAGNLDPWCDAHVCRPDENDAARNNFWRVGLHGRTSFLSDYQPEDGAEGDKGLFTATWQLGVLAVRMHSDEISCSLYDVDTNGDSCAA